jgi:hypothetical protein
MIRRESVAYSMASTDAGSEPAAMAARMAQTMVYRFETALAR